VRRKKQRVLFLHYTGPTILGGVEHVMGIHARAAQAAGDDVAIVAGRGSARGIPFIRIPELDSQHPAVLRDRAALGRGEVTPEHALLVAAIARKLRPVVRRADRVVVHNVFTLHLNVALTEALFGLAAERPGVFIAWTHDLAWTDVQYKGQRHEGRPQAFAAGLRQVAGALGQEGRAGGGSLEEDRLHPLEVGSDGLQDVGDLVAGEGLH